MLLADLENKYNSINILIKEAEEKLKVVVVELEKQQTEKNQFIKDKIALAEQKQAYDQKEARVKEIFQNAWLKF